MCSSDLRTATTKIDVTKTWIDHNNADKTRPDKITIILLKDGIKIKEQEVSESDGWKYTFDNLEKYNNKNEEIHYTIEEETVNGYTSIIDGYNITNKYSGKVKTSISGKKIWKDYNNKDNTRPNEIEVNLVKEGKVKKSDGRPVLYQLVFNENEKRDFESLKEFGKYASGTKVVEKPEMLFARLDPKEVAKKVEVIEAKQKASIKAVKEKKEKEAKETKEEITIDDFSKIQLKVGKVIKCEKHPNADKLLVSQIDVGEETPRQIVSGIADVYSPEEFTGKKVIVVTNLKPAKLRGVESQGMVLAGGDKKVLGVVDAGELPVGTTIR